LTEVELERERGRRGREGKGGNLQQPKVALTVNEKAGGGLGESDRRRGDKKAKQHPGRDVEQMGFQ